MSNTQEISNRILTYLVAHPQSKDTLEGVAHWWLLQQQIEECVSQVQDALDDLVKSEMLIVDHRSHSSTYRLNSMKLNEIRIKISSDSKP